MDRDWLSYRLRLTAQRIEAWRREADRLQAVAGVVHGASELIEIEETASDIYREIAEFDALVAEIDRVSHAAAGEIAAVGDALRLVLLEITELSLVMYRTEGIDQPPHALAGATLN
jgi:hypothetical protein